LLEGANINFTDNWLVFLRHPTSCNNVIKALYSLCMASVDICAFVSKNPSHMEAIYNIMAGKASIFS
jgi:hypothetical protein